MGQYNDNIFGYLFPASSHKYVLTKLEQGAARINEELLQKELEYKQGGGYGPYLYLSQVDLEAENQLLNSLVAEEGKKNTVYKDSRGFLTVGIGHLVTPADNLKLGDVISEARIMEFYNKDVAKAFSAAKEQATQLGKYNPDMLVALTHVNFQLGTGWRTEFKNTWRMLMNGNYRGAVFNLSQSAWANQTPRRVNAFVASINRNFLEN